MELITNYWDQLIFIGVAIALAVKVKIGLQELEKDVTGLRDELGRRDTYVETVRLRAQFDSDKEANKAQIAGLWDMVNKLRDLINGSGKEK
tara:strand:+ start:7243 stop:7515 length:273 start_codon:yes stop_codon:yes gene_type:complete